MMLLPLHLQCSEQSFSVNQVSPAYTNIEHNNNNLSVQTWICFLEKYFQNITIIDPRIVPSIHTYRSILSILISAATLAKWNAFVTTENQATVTDTSLHTGLVTCAAGACRILTAGLGACIGTVAVVTA